MEADGRFRNLVQRYTGGSGLAAVRRTRHHRRDPRPASGARPGDLRAATYASSDSVLRLLAHMVRNDVSPREAEPPAAAVEYAPEFVRQGVPLDSLLRAYHIGHATFFHRWSEAVHADPHPDGVQAHAIEQGADWTFEFVEALSAGLVRTYAVELSAGCAAWPPSGRRASSRS